MERNTKVRPSKGDNVWKVIDIFSTWAFPSLEVRQRREGNEKYTCQSLQVTPELGRKEAERGEQTEFCDDDDAIKQQHMLIICFSRS